MRVMAAAALVLIPMIGCTAGPVTDATDDSDEASTWRSALYPEDWTPGFATDDGAFLHDFSYAGYRWGGEPLVRDPSVDVIDLGADPTAAVDSTAAIQQAIDQVSDEGGGVVLLPAGTYRLDGLLTVEASGVVLRGEGSDQTRLAFTRHEGMTGRGHLTLAGAVEHGEDRLLTEDVPTASTRIPLADTEGLEVGDVVALGFVITDDFVAEHGMEGTWQAFNGTWRPIFRRTVMFVGDDFIEVHVPTRYPLRTRDGASLRIETGHLTEVGVEDLAVSTEVDWQDAWSVDRSHAIHLVGVRDGWVHDVASFDSPLHDDPDHGERHLMSGGIKVLDSHRVTLAGLDLRHAQNRGPGGNGYLVEISRSNEVLVRDSLAVAGRHNFIQNWDFGTTGCVFLRTTSRDGKALTSASSSFSQVGLSEFHHSLAMANLIDDSVADDGWGAVNRHDWSSGAGHTATESVFWNLRGTGRLRSFQAGRGYVIGTGPELSVETALDTPDLFGAPEGTAPEDWSEGLGEAATLTPRSLYEDQRRRRSMRD